MAAFKLFIGLLLAPIALYFGIRAAPSVWLGGWGGCRQVQVPNPESIFADKRPRCVAIIGASAGIGQDMAYKLSEYDNVKLLVTGRTAQRAMAALPPFKHRSIILARGLDLYSDDSIDAFVEELSRTVSSECANKLDYLILNAGQIYPDRYNGSYVSDDGKFDRLFRVNFISYIRLLRGLTSKLNLSQTRTVFVSSVAHYTGLPSEVLRPNLNKKVTVSEQMGAYSNTKLALSTLQQILARDGVLPNSVAATCGAALTTISLSAQDRLKGKTMQGELGTVPNLIQFTSEQGADIVLSAAFLQKEAVQIGEFAVPYFYGFSSLISEASFFSRSVPRWVRVVINVAYEHLFQKLTYTKGKLWVCPASVESRNTTFQNQVKELYWKGLFHTNP